MKVFAFLYLAVFLVVEITSSDTDELTEAIQKWFEDCGNELEIPKEKMEEIAALTVPSTKEPETCIMACVFEKAGFMENDKLMSDKMMNFLNEHKDKEEIKGVEEALEKCLDEASREEKKCAVAGKFIKCVFDELKAKE